MKLGLGESYIKVDTCIHLEYTQNFACLCLELVIQTMLHHTVIYSILQ